MPTNPNKAKLLWNCRRGMLELDLILSRFMSNHFDSLTPKQISSLETLLSYQDPDLYVWLIGQAQPDDKELAEIVAYIRLQNTI